MGTMIPNEIFSRKQEKKFNTSHVENWSTSNRITSMELLAIRPCENKIRKYNLFSEPEMQIFVRENCISGH